MGLLDQVGGALGGALGQSGGGVKAILLQQLVAMLSKPGALQQLMSSFKGAGLENILQSWIGTGQNLPISADQVTQVLGGGKVAQDAFLIVGFALLGLSYGQAAGTVTANFAKRFRYTGAALTSDFAWLIGAAFAPLVALGLSARFGLVAVSAYLLSGVACTLLALRINKAFETDRNKA